MCSSCVWRSADACKECKKAEASLDDRRKKLKEDARGRMDDLGVRFRESKPVVHTQQDVLWPTESVVHESAYMATKKAIYRCPVFGMVGSECPTRRNAGYGAYTPCEDGLVTACLEEQDRSDMAADEIESIRQDHEDAIWNRGEDW